MLLVGLAGILAAGIAARLLAGARASVDIAILPFANKGPGTDDPALRFGLAQTLTAALGRVPRIAPTSQLIVGPALADRELSDGGEVAGAAARELAGFLHVHRLVIGTYACTGDSLKVTCRLVDARTGRADTRHTITLARTLKGDADRFALQKELAMALPPALGVRLTDRERALIAQTTDATANWDAYRLSVAAREKMLPCTPEAFSQSVSLLRKALALDPSYAQCAVALGETYGGWGSWKRRHYEDPQAELRQALHYAQLAVALAPRLSDGHSLLAAVYRRVETPGLSAAERSRLAEKEGRVAVALNDSDAIACIRLYGALGWPTKGDGAAYLARALRLRPRSAAVLESQGYALRKQGQLARAIRAYRAATQADPYSSVACTELAITLRRARKLTEAAAACQKAIELGTDNPQAYYVLGCVCMDGGRAEDAIGFFQMAIAASPRCSDAYCGLGSALGRTGKIHDSVAAFRTAIALAPRNARAHSGLGFSLERQGKWDEAIAAYRRAIALSPNYPLPHYYLGLALKARDDRKEALTELRKYLQLAANDRLEKKRVFSARTTLREWEAKP